MTQLAFPADSPFTGVRLPVSEARALPGLLLVVSSPSAAGKTTLCRRLLAEFPRLTFSVSTTTRPPRQGEQDGVDYHFVDAATFQRRIDAGDFAEWAEVHGQRYGTGMEAIRVAASGGEDVLFDIDYQGARQLRARFSEAILVFVLPPSIEELERRLRQRATESEVVIARRLAKAREELGHYSEYDYAILNDDLETATQELRSVYLAAHMTAKRHAAHAEALLRSWKP